MEFNENSGGLDNSKVLKYRRYLELSFMDSLAANPFSWMNNTKRNLRRLHLMEMLSKFNKKAHTELFEFKLVKQLVNIKNIKVMIKHAEFINHSIDEEPNHLLKV